MDLEYGSTGQQPVQMLFRVPVLWVSRQSRVQHTLLGLSAHLCSRGWRVQTNAGLKPWNASGCLLGAPSHARGPAWQTEGLDP